MSAKTCFVTVGSTSFTPLVHAVLAPESLAALQSLAFTSLIIQYGNSVLPVIASPTRGKDAGICIELVQWVDGLERVIADAQLVVSHAGAGSILTTLRLAKPLIVVVNLALMDNHQAELADTLETKHVLVSSTPIHLASAIATLHSVQLELLPPPNTGNFLGIVDREMGYL